MNAALEKINSIVGRYYLIISITLLGLIVLAMLNLFIWPQYQRMTDDGVLQDQNMTSILQQRQNYLDQLRMMEASYQTIDQRIMRDVAIVLPAPISDGVIYAEFESIVTGTNFQIDSINITKLNYTPLDTTVTLPYEVVNASVNISSQTEQTSYADFKKLLHNIEQHPRLLDLESLTYSSSENSYTFPN